MDLQHIDLTKLKISPANMRHGRKEPDVADLVPSVRARGILQPLLVRPDGVEFEIVAGRRRYFAAKVVAAEQGSIDPLPCAVMAPGDDAAALEASLIENIARLDADEMTQYETFVRLTKAGKSVAEIATTFGLTDRLVEQRLALGNLLPKIREAYRQDEIDTESIRHLTLASKAQQKEWLKLFEDPESHAPTGYHLKQWLFGGQSIATKVALFPLDQYPGPIVSDLFGEDSYFADPDQFWTLQNQAIAAKRDALLEAGWSEVLILEPGRSFATWEHVRTPKKKGGKVFVTVSPRGEVEGHDGWLSAKEARRNAKRAAAGDSGNKTGSAQPPMSQGVQNYLELHRHAVARLALLANPGTALRLLVAHAVAPSGHWHVKPEPQIVRGDAIRKSVTGSAAQQAFQAERAQVRALLDRPDDDGTVAWPSGDSYQTAAVFARLLTLSDDDVLRVAACVMAETLAAGSPLVEAVGIHRRVDARTHWQPDDAFFDLVRDRATVNAMLADIAGKDVADGNVAERAKTQKRIVRDHLAGTNGRTKIEGRLPGLMQFPFRAYGEQTSAIGEAAAAITDLFPASA